MMVIDHERGEMRTIQNMRRVSTSGKRLIRSAYDVVVPIVKRVWYICCNITMIYVMWILLIVRTARVLYISPGESPTYTSLSPCTGYITAGDIDTYHTYKYSVIFF
jgi:hypothetical protein